MKLRLCLMLTALMLVFAGPAWAQDCGNQEITIARMQWPSAAILAEIHALLLGEQLGCITRTVPGDLAASASSMATTGQPAVTPELWITRITEIWNAAIAAQALRPAGQSYQGGAFEGWFVPGYVADANPEVTSAAAIATHLEAFAAADPTSRPRFISCPPDWACSVINRNLIAALGLAGRFEVIEPATRFEMDRLIAEAINLDEPILFYYWQPNAILTQFDFRALDMGAYDAEAFQCLGRRSCIAPKPSAFVAETVVNAVASWVFQDAPAVAGYFGRASMPLREMNVLLAKLNEPGQTIESVAQTFVDTRRSVWSAWVGR